MKRRLLGIKTMGILPLTTLEGVSRNIPFRQDFSELSDGAFPAPWLGGATWAVAGGVAVNTPVLGGELVVNGDMEAGDPPTGWIAGGGGILDGVADERTGGAGVQSMSVTNPAAPGFGTVSRTMAHAAGIWVRHSGWARLVTTAACRIDLESAGYSSNLQDVYVNVWSERIGSDLLPYANHRVFGRNTDDGANEESRFDDLSVKPLSFAEVLNLINFGASDVQVRASGTIYQATSSGVCARVDDEGNPQNGLFAYRNHQSVRLVKIVSGTPTVLIDTGVALVTGQLPEIRCSGSLVQLWYNDIQIGATQTVNDATITNNPLHGLIGTHPSSTITSVEVFPF